MSSASSASCDVAGPVHRAYNRGMDSVHRLKLKLQVCCGDEIAMGPGKADLLEAIDRAGSISAAGRMLGMSYRRAWLLVDAMNRSWDAPLVATLPGGSARSGAALTSLGREVLGHYRAMNAACAAAAEAEWAALSARLLPAPRPRAVRAGTEDDAA